MSDATERADYEQRHLLGYSCAISNEELSHLDRNYSEGYQKYKASHAIGRTLVDSYFSYSHQEQFGAIYRVKAYVFGIDELKTYKKLLKAEWEAERETTCN